jgi:ribonuclease BN (tRNA processing enzyme)
LFIAHNAVPEGATGVERRLHMPPSVIGQIAQEAHVKRLVLSPRMLRTLGKEELTYQSSLEKVCSYGIVYLVFMKEDIPKDAAIVALAKA